MNPEDLRGTNTGVFLGQCITEAEMVYDHTNGDPNGFFLSGCLRAVVGHRVAYWLGVHGQYLPLLIN